MLSSLCANESRVHGHVDGWNFLKNSYIENRIRQNLREKHARHIADLRAYYDSEIQSLKQQLESSHRTAASEDLKQINQSLADRYSLSFLSFSLHGALYILKAKHPCLEYLEQFMCLFGYEDFKHV